jgi:beta-glucosidase
MTFPKQASDVPANTPQQYPGINDQSAYSEGVFVGYRHYDAQNITPLFPFGYGLSYTTFAYNHLSVSPVKHDVASSNQRPISVSVNVTNTGSRAGAEVAQLYLDIPSTNVPEPPRQLKGFQKVFLQPGQTRRVTFSLDQNALSYWDAKAHGWVVQKGTYQVMVGSSSSDVSQSQHFEIDRTNGPRYVTVQAPGLATPGTTSTVTMSFTNGGDFDVQHVQLSLQTSSGWNAQALSTSSFKHIAAGQTVQTQWRVTIPDNAQPGSYTLTEIGARKPPCFNRGMKRRSSYEGGEELDRLKPSEMLDRPLWV